jgi:uncharacterized protein
LTAYFFDSSALVKRYIIEVGSAWTIALTDRGAGHSIVLAEITRAEVAAALAARQRASPPMTLGQRDRILGRFLQDCIDLFLLFPIDRTVINFAVHFARRYRLRGYDAVQLAAAALANQDALARRLPPLGFVCADNDLLAAAQAEGLATDNPLNHP